MAIRCTREGTRAAHSRATSEPMEWPTIENFSAALGYARWSEFLVFMVLTLVLLFKPTGILGAHSGDRA